MTIIIEMQFLHNQFLRYLSFHQVTSLMGIFTRQYSCKGNVTCRVYKNP